MTILYWAINICSLLLPEPQHKEYIFEQCTEVAKECLTQGQRIATSWEQIVSDCEETTDDWLSNDRAEKIK